MSIAHVLPIGTHAWVWFLGGGLVVLIRVFWEPVMKFLQSTYATLKAFHEYRKAKTDATISKAQLAAALEARAERELGEKKQETYNLVEQMMARHSGMPLKLDDVYAETGADFSLLSEMEGQGRLHIMNGYVHPGRHKRPPRLGG